MSERLEASPLVGVDCAFLYEVVHARFVGAQAFQESPTEHEAIERGQIRRAPPGSITDKKLMFEQKRLCGDRVYAVLNALRIPIASVPIDS